MSTTLRAVSIREATVSDKPAAAIVQRSVLPDGHRYLYFENIATVNRLNLVAVDTQQVIGFVSVLLTRERPSEQHWWGRVAPYLAFIGVLPEHQRCGTGAFLLRFAIAKTATLCRNESLMFLEHTPENPANRLFARQGFKSVTSEDAFAVAGIHAKGPVMSLQLEQFRIPAH